MKVAKTIKEARKIIKAAKKKGNVIGFVPTMGALHQGHLSLMRAAKNRCDYVAVSIFVNPTQFGAGSDYRRYPRNLEKDLKIARQTKIDLVFVPKVPEMYPDEQLSWVEVRKMQDGLCGRFRPGHFQGVATVVTKLFNIVQPDKAFFGQKDAQQARIIKKMVKDLNLDIKIEILPTVREKDGLAMSSRNTYLNSRERKAAAVLYKSLKEAGCLIKNGEKNPGKVIQGMRRLIEKEPLAGIDYIERVDPASLAPLKIIKNEVLVSLAVWIGKARLIDNLKVRGGSRCKG